MANGIFVSVKTNEPVLYLVGILIFLASGIALSALAFTSVIGGGAGLGIAGAVVAIGAAVLLVEYMATR